MNEFYEKADLFFKLHKQTELLILPNAWDAVSAKLFEQAGATAVATTSAGIAATFGYPDGQIPRDLMLTMVERIVKSVNIPVSVDLEAGYGQTTEEICETIDAIIRIGAVGINIEDADPKQPGHLFSITEQVSKIKAIRAYVREKNIPLYINARTDVFWLNLYTPEKRMKEALTRLKAYQEAGADGVFIPGLTDISAIIEITKTIQLPINLLGGSWIKDINALQALGVSRVTIGSGVTRDVAGHVQKLANQLIQTRDFSCINPAISYSNFCSLFSAAPSEGKSIAGLIAKVDSPIFSQMTQINQVGESGEKPSIEHERNCDSSS